jgi:hypothetical protein
MVFKFVSVFQLVFQVFFCQSCSLIASIAFPVVCHKLRMLKTELVVSMSPYFICPSVTINIHSKTTFTFPYAAFNSVHLFPSSWPIPFPGSPVLSLTIY